MEPYVWFVVSAVFAFVLAVALGIIGFRYLYWSSRIRALDGQSVTVLLGDAHLLLEILHRIVHQNQLYKNGVPRVFVSLNQDKENEMYTVYLFTSASEHGVLQIVLTLEVSLKSQVPNILKGKPLDMMHWALCYLLNDQFHITLH